jgi:hypothetical protein
MRRSGVAEKDFVIHDRLPPLLRSFLDGGQIGSICHECGAEEAARGQKRHPTMPRSEERDQSL